MTARRRFGATLVALAAMGASWLPAGPAFAEEPALASALTSAPPGTSVSAVKTTVVGMTLRGVKQFDRLVIPDFDILVQTNGDRLLPLLRTLRFMGIEARTSGSKVSFAPEPSTPIALDPDKGLLEVGATVREVETVSGISDVTGESEIYIPESVVAEILGVGIDWNPNLYEYTIRSSRPLDVFERQFTRGRSVSGADAFESYALPGNLPPADPTPSIVPKLLFARVQLQASAIRHGDETRTTGTFSPPRGALWAQIFGGNLNTRVSQRTESPGDGFKVDALAWNTVFDETALSLGSGNVGLSQLVFPSLSLVGATINGNVGSGSNLASRDPSQLGRMQTYAPLHVFEGFAPLGSNVSLWVNDNLVESKTVEPTTGAPPGEGAYRFEGLNLFTSRLNEVRVVTTAPDGTVEESRRRVLGTDHLLSSGRVAFVGVAGRRRRFSADNLAATGAFGGGRVDYGLSQRLTVGASGGFQRDIFLEEDESVFGGEHLRRPPSQSLHLGSRVVWQPVDPLLLSMEGARSGWYADSSTGATLRADGEYHLGNFEIRSGVFRYEPGFFDGQNQELNDIQGGNLGIALKYARGHQLGLVGSRLRDNLDGARASTTRVREAQASWSVQGLIPRSTLTVAGRQIWGWGVSRHRSYVLGLESSLPWHWEFRGRYEFGDDIPGLLRKEMSVGTYERFDLADRMPTGFYLPGLSLGSGSLNSIFELRRRTVRNWQLSLTHRSAGTFERSSVDLVRSVSAQSRWQTRISPGYDWNKQSALIQNRLEVFLDQSRRNRVSLEANYDDHEWSARISMGLQLDFGFSGLAPVPLFDGRVDPDAGGVRGRVFLDQNGNGLPDRGERGLDGIDIMSGQGSRAVSGNDGIFLLPNGSNLRRVRVRLDPASLSAIYTPTQATQEAILRPGIFTEVNLGISMLGTVSGVLLGRPAPTDSSAATDPAGPAAAELKGVPGVKVLLVAEDGRVAGFSVTGNDGVYTIVDAKPGRYKIRPDAATLPEGFQLDIGEIPVEVRSGEDAADLRAADLIGHHTSPRPKVDEGAKKDIEYKIFR